MQSRVLRLMDLDFVRNGTNIVIIANPGVGKTFLAKILAWRACQANQRVLFTTAMDMLNHLLASQVDHSLVRKLRIDTEPTVLVCDGLGYLSLDQQTANLFYQIHPSQPQAQHRRNGISDWGNILHDTTIAKRLRIGVSKTPLFFCLRRQFVQNQQESESAGRLILGWPQAGAGLW